jgi:hypothetical protein
MIGNRRVRFLLSIISGLPVFSLHTLLAVVAISLLAFLAVLGLASIFASYVGFGGEILVVMAVLLLSSMGSHYVARCCPKNDLAQQYWRAVDYLWPLAAFGTIILGYGARGLDQGGVIRYFLCNGFRTVLFCPCTQGIGSFETTYWCAAH